MYFGGDMTQQCANENCRTRLHSFTEGRIFQFEIVAVSMSADNVVAGTSDESEQRETAQFWLCGNCASTMTLVLDSMQGLKLIAKGGEYTSPAEKKITGAAANYC